MFRCHSRQNEGVQEPQKIMINQSNCHDLQTSDGESCMCNQTQQERGPFQRFEGEKHCYAQQ